MAEPSKRLINTVRAIDRFSDRIGFLVAWLNLPLALAVGYEVVSRYVFNVPTVWAYDVTYMLYGTIFMLGTAFALHKGAHIRTDLFYDRWSAKTQGLIDTISYVVFFFPAFLLLLITSANEAWYAFSISETSEQTPWRPIIWPFKVIVPVTCLLLMIQGLSELIKSFYSARIGVVFEQKKKAEL